MSEKTKVDIIESEASWGRKVDHTKEFNTYKEAEEYCKEYNNKYNNEEHTPDWYMYARIQGQKQYGMLK